MSQYKELSQIDAKYRPEINLGDKTLCIDVDDYIALYNMAEYSELLIQEQEQERLEQDKMDRLYWGVVDD